MTTDETWHVAPLTSRPMIRRMLNQDRAYSAYMLGDLDEPHWKHCSFVGAWPPGSQPGDPPQALILRYDGFDPALLVVSGSTAGVTAILRLQPVSSSVYFTASGPLLPVLERRYHIPSPAHMWRMALSADAFPGLPDTGEEAVPLTGSKATALLTAFFAGMRQENGNHFSPEQVKDDAFFGIFVDSKLVSVAGTHLVSETESVAAVGNIYTLPDYRGRGYATQCTAATVASLLERGIQDIVLNVRQDNLTAIHIYEKLGFRRHVPFWEGMAYSQPPSVDSQPADGQHRRQGHNPVLK